MQQVNDFGVNIYFKSLKYLFLGVFLLTCVNTNSLAQRKEKNDLLKVRNQLGAGINLSALEHNWKAPDSLLQYNWQPIIKEIIDHGFKTIRLPVAFDHFAGEKAEIPAELIKMVQDIYYYCNKEGVHLILVYHYGKLFEYNTDYQIDRISKMWEQWLRNFQNKGYNNLLFELYNEPTLDRWVWKYAIERIVARLRQTDQQRIFIVGGTNYNGYVQTLELGTLNDNRILYTFHFYEPYLFTHQGAEWTIDKSYLTGFPYPYKKNRMPQLKGAIKGSVVYEDYYRYYREATKTYLTETIKKLVADANHLNMPLICTETGVILNVDGKYRENYLRDITEVLSEFKIPTMLWDYNDRFSIRQQNGKLLSPVKGWIKKSR